ncbi:hypothetical protein [Planobispora takensis]|uniref:Uncharacterized protein n=1 Tax=Planobispora takensis TaxID=1367882 RepID=A0A8J3T2H0_9ACTN|nr:hypothetical protein [Planobispora takensis]GII03211.1 hypothetical protein Pta02_52190 [Planobispora takensis]
MTTVHPRRPVRRYGPQEDPAVAETEAIVQALSGRQPVELTDDALRLLAALIDDVDQRCSSVSITPSA